MSTSAPVWGKNFGKFRGQWLDQVHDDPEMKGDSVRVMYAITRFMRSNSGYPNPGNAILKDTAHVNEKTVRRSLELAQKRGHLDIKEDGRRSPRILIPRLNDYTESGQDTHTESGQDAHTESGQSDSESGHESGQQGGKSVHSKHEIAPIRSNGCMPLSQKPQKSQKNTYQGIDSDSVKHSDSGPTFTPTLDAAQVPPAMWLEFGVARSPVT